jgi:uncharacterized protein YjeT (DUF2065 family)
MDTVIKITGIVFVCAGILYFLKPAIMKSIMEFFRAGNRIYLAGILRFILAIVFLLGARECDITWVIVVFAILFMVSGLLIFILGPKKTGAILDWYLRQPLLIFRILAVVAMLIGGIIVYSA